MGRPNSRGEAIRLPVLTVYYRVNSVVKTNRSGRPLNAVKNCVGHMRTNQYEATHAEVYHSENGRLYGVVRRDVEGNLKVLYEHKFRKNEIA